MKITCNNSHINIMNLGITTFIKILPELNDTKETTLEIPVSLYLKSPNPNYYRNKDTGNFAC